MNGMISKHLFGTDGIRGHANQWPIVPEMMVQIGRAVAHYFQSKDNINYFQNAFPIEEQLSNRHPMYHPYIQDLSSTHPCTVIIGKDTRLSGYMIESALVAGLVSQGAHVIMLGPVPTPAVAMLVRSLRADIGIMISASHNPYQDNGIKFFDHNGIKFHAEVEHAIEQIVWNNEIPFAINCGKSMRLDDAAGRYVEFAKATFPKGRSLSGVKILVDCANGATYKVAPRIFWELGASVRIIGDTPNGRNINEKCGALYPHALLDQMKQEKADVGIALDGDGDRILMVTPNQTIINGDQILALIASHFNKHGRLKHGIVSTCMSNLGFKRYLQNVHIPYFESSVGDKNVLERMLKQNCNLGGEESGHVILNDYTTTGDGIIAALQVLEIVLEEGAGFDDLFPVFQSVPQEVQSFKMNEAITDDVIVKMKQLAKNIIGTDGEVVIRRSGTEPVLRVMIQSEQPERIQEVFRVIANFDIDETNG